MKLCGSYWNLIRKSYFQAPTLKLKTSGTLKFTCTVVCAGMCSHEKATAAFICNQIGNRQAKEQVT